MPQVNEITRQQLEHLIQRQNPENEDNTEGYALVNVLSPESFEEEHIPGSINIPQGEEEKFEQRFAKDKEIIVYCASESCDASPKAAEELRDRGFSKIYDYADGMKDWKEADNPVERSNGA